KVNGVLLDLVGEFAAAVPALAGVALGVFVGEDGAHGAQHVVADEVLAGDQVDRVRLAFALGMDQFFNGGHGSSFGTAGFGFRVLGFGNSLSEPRTSNLESRLTSAP